MSVNSAHTKILDRGTVLAKNGQGDLQLVFGSSSMSKSFYFGTVEINRFALRKPVIHSQAVGPLTDAQMAASQCGLSPITLTKMLAMSIGVSSIGSHTPAEVIAEVAQWIYNRPNGNGSQGQWWRTLDFYPYSSLTGSVGYNKEAVAPDSGWAGKSFTTQDLNTMAAITETITGSGNAFVLAPSSAAYLYQNFNAKFGQESAKYKGDVTNMEIPITWVTGLTGNWRMAIAVCIPVNGKNYWHYFIGRRIIQDYLNGVSGVTIANIMPDFGTNPAGAEYMRQYVVANGATDFSAIPVFVKDIGYEYVNVNGQKFQPKIVSSTTTVYCMPSGTNSLIVHGGSASFVAYYSIVRSSSGGIDTFAIENTDSRNSHTYKFNRRQGATVVSTGTVTVAAGSTSGTVFQNPTSNSPNIQVIEQDGVPVPGT